MLCGIGGAMAEPVETPNLVTQIFAVLGSLPPPLQGVAIFGIFVGVTWVLVQRFMKRLTVEPAEKKLVAVGEAFQFADMQPVRDLAKGLDAALAQSVKTETAIVRVAEGFEAHATKLDAILQVGAELLEFMKEQAELESAEELRAKLYQEGIDRGRQQVLTEIKETRASRRASPRRASPRPRTTPPT